MDDKTHILLIEDDQDVLRMLTIFLEEHQYSVATASQYSEIDPAFSRQNPDMIILDLNFPGGKSGVDVCRELRQRTAVPIVVLTGEERDLDKVLLLEMGADNYLTKPMDPTVLLSYLRATLRRRQESSQMGSLGESIKVFHDLLEFDRFILNLTTRSLSDRDGNVLPLKPAEYDLLLQFVQHPGQVLSRDRLLDLKPGGIVALDRSIDTLVSRIRRCIEKNPKKPELLQTYRHGGYLLQTSVIKKRIESKS